MKEDISGWWEEWDGRLMPSESNTCHLFDSRIRTCLLVDNSTCWMWQCNAVTKHDDLTRYFSQDPGLQNIQTSFFFFLWHYLLYSAFSRRYLSDRLSVVRTNHSLTVKLRYFRHSHMITLAKLNGAQASLWADAIERNYLFTDAVPYGVLPFRKMFLLPEKLKCLK